MYEACRSLLFQLDPEHAHQLTLRALQFGAPLLHSNLPAKPIKLMGLRFTNPIGLAAGFDKNGIALNGLAKLGFGFVEVGTVTPLPQSGNPKPRIFRLPEAQAIINRLGFNNAGVMALAQRLKNRQFPGILGINIGKNAVTPNARAVDDYLACMDEIYTLADYITINISSPNTKDLRDLQQPEQLASLLSALQTRAAQLGIQTNKHVPLVVKLSPDMSATEVQAIAKLLLQLKIDGVIATNTTISRTAVAGQTHAAETGGLSGKPLLSQSTQTIQWLHRVLGDQIPIIGCGGISSPADMHAKFNAGASLVQLYTGLVYQGPRLIENLVHAL